MKPVAVLKKKKFSGAENKKRKKEETAGNAILSERLKRFGVVSTVGIDETSTSSVSTTTTTTATIQPMVTEETTIGEEATDEDVILPSRKIDVNIIVSSNDKISDLSHPDGLSFKDIERLACDQRTNELNISTSLHTEIVKRASVMFQNKGGPFQKIDGRGMIVSWFIKRLGNGTGKTVNHSWLLYSPVNQSAYCFCCLLFSHSASTY